MTFRIASISIYGYNSKRRDLKLNPFGVNIITGDSKTGKTALIEIMDYIFGGSECRGIEGTIKESVAWVGLSLLVGDDYHFVARRLPIGMQKSSSDCYYSISKNITIPNAEDLISNSNVEGMEMVLNNLAGIGENVFIPEDGRSRDPLIANIRHAILYCFQQQTEIVSNNFLFHKQWSDWIPQAIRDTSPYFLGAVPEDFPRKNERLRELRHSQKLFRKAERSRRERETALTPAFNNLMKEAEYLGYGWAEIPDGIDKSIYALKEIVKFGKEKMKTAIVEDAVLNSLREKFKTMEERLAELNDRVDGLKKWESGVSGYANSLVVQRDRLAAIEILPKISDGRVSCPLCKTEVEIAVNETIGNLKQYLDLISNEVGLFQKDNRQTNSLLSRLEGQKREVQAALNSISAEVDSIQTGNDNVENALNMQQRWHYLIGKIEGFLVFGDFNSAELFDSKTISALEHEITKLEQEIDIKVVLDRIFSITLIIGDYMSKWARHLEIEHSQFPFRIDFKRLTLVADTPRGAVSMSQMGSGENWVGHHLISMLGLHKYFSENDRPVPSFVFFDQPSQIGYPPDKDPNQEMEMAPESKERASVVRMYKFLCAFPSENVLSPQIIITDHVDIMEDWFQKNVVEKWRNGKKLVPLEWLSE